LIKNSQPFGKKFQKIVGGIFLTHTVQCATDCDTVKCNTNKTSKTSHINQQIP